MGIYGDINRIVSSVKENGRIPVCIEMNKNTHNALVESLKKERNDDNILSVEIMHKLPIFIDNSLEDGFINVKTQQGKMDVCMDCFDEYAENEGKMQTRTFNEENQCEICRFVRRTTSVKVSSVNFNKVKESQKPNRYF